MRLRVLGPLEVVGEDGVVGIGAAKLRALLAALAVTRGQVSTTDQLIDALWGDAPPDSAAKLLQVYVSQLRRRLPAGLGIRTAGGGYVLEVDPDDVDAGAFERLLADGRAALAGGNPAVAVSTLGRALALWRGPAYGDVRYEAFALPEIDRLERLRDLARDERIEAELRLGRHAEVLGELRGRLAAAPTDEALAATTMLATYRTTGPVEALAVFATVEAAIRAEMGEAPGPALLELRDRIARRDRALDAPPRASPPTVRLPVPPNALIGRQRELAELRDLLARPGIRFVSLTGSGGSGKSRLGLEVAHELAPGFANGAVLVELAALRDPALVAATIARSLGVEPGADAMATLGEVLADLEMLLVLDNIEHLRSVAPDLVRLLGACPHLVLLVTTRVVLHVSGEHVFPVGPLAGDDAVRLFTDRARAVDPSLRLDAETEPLVRSICRRLDDLPLPIELAAARVRALGVRTLDTRLDSRLTVLSHGPRDLPARQHTLREMLDWSVQLLTPRHADVLAALAVFPDSCSMEAAQAIAGADDEAIIELVDHHLVDAIDVAGERRFRLLETVREYAEERLGARRAATMSALTDWMVDLAANVALGGQAALEAAALGRLDAELDNIRVAFTTAAADPTPDRELALAAGTWRYWWIRGYLAEARGRFEEIVARRGLVPTVPGVRTALAAASIAWSMGDMDGATALAADVLVVAGRIGATIDRLSAHNLLGIIATRQGDHAEAEAHLSECIRVAESVGNLELAHTGRLNLGIAYLEAGRPDDARACFLRCLAFQTEGGPTEGRGFVHLNLGTAEHAAGDLPAAEEHFHAAAEAFRSIGFATRLANALQGLAAVEAGTGRAESSARRLGAASALLTAAGWGADGDRLAGTAESMARAALGDAAFESLFAAGAAEARRWSTDAGTAIA